MMRRVLSPVRRWFGGYAVRPARPAPPAALLHRISGATMGTRFQVTFAAAPMDLTDLGAALFAAVDAVDRQMSTYKPSSDLSRFNGAALDRWVPVPAAVARVVTEGLRISSASQGAFDMTLGGAVNAWGFGPDPAPVLPDQAQPLGQYATLQVRCDPPALCKSAPFALDLSGIAKGFAVDELVRVLESRAITNYLAEIDGEVRARGRKPGLQGAWSVGLDAPVAGQRAVWDVLLPGDGALATSGDYRHFVVTDGKVRAHSIDGRSGWPVDNDVASVTVRHASCMTADAWATALLVLGQDQGPAVAEAQGIQALFLVRSGTGIAPITTCGFTADGV